MRVRQRGHSRDEAIMRSEQLRHIAKWLQNHELVVRTEFPTSHERVPAINNGDIGLFILADNAQPVSFKIDSGPHHRRWRQFRLRLFGVIPTSQLSLSPCLLFLEALFLHHRVLMSSKLFFVSMYRSLSRAVLTFIAEKSMHAFDEVTLFEQ